MKSNFKKTNIIKEPSKFTIKFANMVFLMGVLFFLLVAAYAVYAKNNNSNYSPTFYYLFILFSILSAALFVIGLRALHNELKVNLSVLLITVGITVYSFEIYLEFFRKESQSQIPKQTGVVYDARTINEVFRDLRDSGVKVYPNVVPSWFTESNGLSTKNEKIYPLGGIANITTVYSKENGYFPIIELDEHGFNNPKGLYKINKVDIMLTGDSFTEGKSVHSNESVGGLLMESGFNTINLGKGGSGPLIEFGALKEYAQPLKPKIVVWLYYVNDLEDLAGEMESSLLKKYLHDNEFSQNLISRQEEIDSLLISYIRSEAEQVEWGKIIRFIKLDNLRSMINLVPKLPSTPPLIFKDILQKSKQMVSGWGGKLYLVYLPSYNLYSRGQKHNNREYLLNTTTELEIPIIDIQRDVFNPHPDPLSLFTKAFSPHYNAKGYRLVGEAIINRLNADGIFPLLNSNN